MGSDSPRGDRNPIIVAAISTLGVVLVAVIGLFQSLATRLADMFAARPGPAATVATAGIGATPTTTDRSGVAGEATAMQPAPATSVVAARTGATAAPESSVVPTASGASGGATATAVPLMATATPAVRVAETALPSDAAAAPSIERGVLIEVGGEVKAVALSPDARVVAALASDATVLRFDAGSGEQLREIHLEGQPNWSGLAFSPDGKYLATGDWQVTLWDAVTGGKVRDIAADSRVVGFTVDGTRLVVTTSGITEPSGARDALAFYDIGSGDQLAMLNREGTDSVNAIAFSADGGLLAAANDDYTVTLWRPADGEELRTMRGHDSGVWSVAVSPDGKTVASGTISGDIRLWDAASGKSLFELREHNSDVLGLAFSADGRYLISAGWDGKVRVWSVGTGERLLALNGHEEPITGLSMSADHATFATSSEDGSVRIWHLR